MIELHKILAEYTLHDGIRRKIEFHSTLLEDAEVDAWVHIIDKHDLKVIKHHNPGVPLKPDDASNIKIISLREIT